MSNKPVAYFGGGCVLVVAVILVLMGLLFMIGSSGKAGTLVTGLIMLGIGATAGIVTIRLLFRLAQTSPDSVDERVLGLARMSGGEVTAGEAVGALGVPLADAQASLERLVQKGLAEHKMRGDNLYYAFAGIKEDRKVKRCAYCGTEFPVREPGMKCSSCGGNLEMVTADD